jgi:hypothetical protein
MTPQMALSAACLCLEVNEIAGVTLAQLVFSS